MSCSSLLSWSAVEPLPRGFIYSNTNTLVLMGVAGGGERDVRVNQFFLATVD